MDSLLCACGCGKSIKQRPGRGRRRKYVNAAHQRRHWDEVHPRVKVTVQEREFLRSLQAVSGRP
jgi:hypothetical protein